MDSAIIEKLLRQALQALAGFVVAKGWLSGETATLIVGVVASAAVAGWMAFRNTKTARVADVAAMPEVKVIGTTVEIARAIPAQEVIPASSINNLQGALLDGAQITSRLTRKD